MLTFKQYEFPSYMQEQLTTRSLQPAKILITGGLGFIFSHVAEWFKLRGHDVTIVDALLDGCHPELVDKFTELGINVHAPHYAGYLVSRNSPLYNEQYDFIIHAAAESNVDKSINDPNAFVHTNILETHGVLEWIRKTQQNLKMLLYISTDEVYGSVCVSATNKSPLFPSSPYAASKAAAGMLCHSYSVTYEMPVKEFRMCNIIGKRQATTKLLPRVIDCIQNDKTIPVYDNGFAHREYLDVRLIGFYIERYLAESVRYSDDLPNFLQPYVSNITKKSSWSILDVIKKVVILTGKMARSEAATRPGHDMNYSMWPAEWMEILPNIEIEDTIKWMLTEGDD